MKVHHIVIAIILSTFYSIQAQDFVFFTGGLKFGYSFGENGGFTYGFEISTVACTFDESVYGAALSYDITGELHKVHFGLEAALAPLKRGFNFWGFEAGPTYAWNDSEDFFGLGVMSYFGTIIIPEYSFTYLENYGTLHEIGTYVKLGFLLKGDFKQ